MLEEVSRTLPTESQQTLESIVPTVEIPPLRVPHKKDSPKRKTRVGVKSARADGTTSDSSPVLVKSAEHSLSESPKQKSSRRATVSQGSDRPNDGQDSHRKRNKPTRTLSAGSGPDIEPDSVTSESTVSLDTIQEETSSQKKKLRRPKFLPLDNIEPSKKRATIYPETARSSYVKSSSRRKSVGPDEPEADSLAQRFKKDSRRGQTVENLKTGAKVSPSNSSEGANLTGSTSPKSDHKDRGQSRERDRERGRERRSSRETIDRSNVRRAKSDSTLSLSRIHPKSAEEKEQPKPKPKFQDLKASTTGAVTQTSSTEAMTFTEDKEHTEEREDMVYRMENKQMTLVWARFEAIMDLLMNTKYNIGKTLVLQSLFTVPVEPQILSVLLYTYPLFTTSHKVLASVVDHMCHAPPEHAAKVHERTNVILSKWLELQYNWEIERDKTLFRSIEKVIKGKIAPDNKSTANELESELYKVHILILALSLYV